MTVIAFQIMKYYRKFLSQFKINITTPMSRTSRFYCYMIMISYFIVFCSKHFILYPAFITSFKTSFIFCRHGKIFIKMFFYYFFAILFFFNNSFNKFIDCIFSSAKNKWFAKSIINTYSFVSKTARNMFLIFYSVWSTIFFLSLPLTPFKIDSKSA